ncbi:MAG: hydantoinase/oxoprolinase family protein [Desulfatibacillaceae bacterium]|nr:hydantoinase/oxoprolinase family protein [Desulfatibacillaceae bacterium]
MILGLDVGGTQTDAVILENGQIVASCKTVNRPNLLETLNLALDDILSFVDSPSKIRRMVFSTTMATNAVVQDTMDPAGMIVSAGPGMNPLWFEVGPSFHLVKGCMDHRGQEVTPINKAQVLGAAASMQKQGIDLCGVVCKFSVRNPLHENLAGEWITPDFDFVALGHRFSGSLNFPRRVATTYLNAALYKVHKRFVDALEKCLARKGLNAPRYLMKPDGGTVNLSSSHFFPAQASQSGPAASIMGALALDSCKGQSLVMDIGGTTTDMALMFDGLPLLVPGGILLGRYQTNIRSLQSRSIGMGGDSRIAVDEAGELTIGPIRDGSPVAFGGPSPTPTDALVTLGLMEGGNAQAATLAMKDLGQRLDLDAVACSHRVLRQMALGIARQALEFINYVNDRPVYTIHEVVQSVEVQPEAIVVLGGPAAMLAPYLERAFALPCRVPPHFAVANAVGAAAARVTSEITLQADTQRGTAVIPEAGLELPVARDFSMGQAQEMALEALRARALKEGATEGEFSYAVTERESFNMIRGSGRTGKNIRLKLTIVPGLIPEWERKEAAC